MSVRDWLPGMTVSLDPDAVEDYEFDFNAWMDGEESILASLVNENCAASIVGNVENGVVVVRVGEVVAGAFVTVRVEAASGRRNDFTINFRPIEQ